MILKTAILVWLTVSVLTFVSFSIWFHAEGYRIKDASVKGHINMIMTCLFWPAAWFIFYKVWKRRKK